MNYQGNIIFKDEWYGVRAEFIVDDPGEEGKLTGHPDSQYPASPPSLYFEEIEFENPDAASLPVGVLSVIEDELLKRLGEDDDYEFDIYLN